jgi:hypothetical protein
MIKRRRERSSNAESARGNDLLKGISIGAALFVAKAERYSRPCQRAAATDPTYRPRDLWTYYAVKIPVGVDLQALTKALSTWPSVLFAYLEPPPVEPPTVNPADDPRSPNQAYLDPAPDGIDAEYAWALPAETVRANRSWIWSGVGPLTTKISRPRHDPISGINHLYFFHRTGVLGELGAVDNALGCVEIVPALSSVPCCEPVADGRRLQHVASHR